MRALHSKGLAHLRKKAKAVLQFYPKHEVATCCAVLQEMLASRVSLVLCEM